MFKRLFNWSRIARTYHVRLGKRFFGFVARFDLLPNWVRINTVSKYGFVFCVVVGALGIVGSFKVPKSFGKTHFIVGYPHNDGRVSNNTASQDRACNRTADSARTKNNANSGGQTTQAGVHCVLFAPDDNVQDELIKLIEQETRSIKMAIFMLTSKPITDALCAAHDRGVKIVIITDNMCARERWSKIHQLTKAGIAVYEYTPPTQSRANDLMHHKFVIFSHNVDNKALVWTGSFNFTQSAQVRNQENAIVLNDTDVVEKFSKQFKRLKKRSKRLS